jgi:hypothetical protein
MLSKAKPSGKQNHAVLPDTVALQQNGEVWMQSWRKRYLHLQLRTTYEIRCSEM